MKFKTERIEKEWAELEQKTPLLCQLVRDLDLFCTDQDHIEPIVTSIYRSLEEQTAIYGTPKPSVHCEWRGVDIRSWTFTAEQIQTILDYLNDLYTYDPSRPEMKVAIYHNVGAGIHLHLQTHPKTQKKNSSLLSQALASLSQIIKKGS